MHRAIIRVDEKNTGRERERERENRWCFFRRALESNGRENRDIRAIGIVFWICVFFFQIDPPESPPTFVALFSLDEQTFASVQCVTRLSEIER